MYNSCTKCGGSGEAICMDCLQLQVQLQDDLKDKKIADLEATLRRCACPMLVDQDACRKIKGFLEECERLHGRCLWGELITNCSHRKFHKHDECWKRFDEANKGG